MRHQADECFAWCLVRSKFESLWSHFGDSKCVEKL